MSQEVPLKERIDDTSKVLHDTVNSILEEEAYIGEAKLRTFNPDESPQAKKQQALNAANESVTKSPVQSSLAADIGSAKNNDVAKALNNINIESTTPVIITTTPPASGKEIKVIDLKENYLSNSTVPVPIVALDNTGTSGTSDTVATPSTFKEGPIKGLPDWFKLGWTAFSCLPNPGDATAMKVLSEKYSKEDIQELYSMSRSSNGEFAEDLLAQFIDEKYFGEWFYNAGVVFVCIFFTWLLTRFGLGLMSCFVVGSFFVTYYRTSIKRTRRNIRDDIQRQVSINSLETDVESVGWMNHFLERFWLIFEPVLSAQIVGQVDTIFSENTPSFLDSIRLSSFTLGTKAPRIAGIKTYPSSAPDVVCMDWDLSFIPNDVLDLTGREAQAKVNPKIVLTIRVGKGMIGAGIPILLEDIAFSGKLRIKIRLFNEMPHVKTVELSFLKKPQFDYVLKPVGGESFGFDINNIPGLETFVKDQVHASLGPMMYSPNVFTLDIAAMSNGASDIDTANGVLAVTMYSATNLKPVDFLGTLDPYCTFHVNDIHNTELARTSTVENNSNPKWNETCFLLLNNLNDVLCFRVMDRTSSRAGSEVGIAMLDLKDIRENQNALEDLRLKVLRSGKQVGEIKADVRYFPVSVPEKQEDGTIIPPPESNSGVVRFYILDCKEVGSEIMQKKGGIPIVGRLPFVGGIPVIGSGSGDVNAYAIVKTNGQEKLRTVPFKHSVNPRWNKFIEVFVADKTKLNFDVTIMNSIGFGDDHLLGRWNSSLTDMERQINAEKNDWWNLKDGSGKLHLNMTWRPILLTGFAAGLDRGSFRHPIGVVRIKVKDAKNLKNLEKLTGGKSDPYVRVMSGLQSRAQTEAIMSELNPVWDTALYIPIHSLREDLLLEVMDWEVDGRHRPIGMCDLLIKDIVKERNEDGISIYEARETVNRSSDLMNNERRRGRGILNYEATFYPTLALAKEVEKSEKSAKSVTSEISEISESTMTSMTEINTTENKSSSSLLVTDLHGEIIQYTDNQKINLTSYNNGVLTVTIHEVILPTKSRAVAEMLLDSNDAQFCTSTIKGTTLYYNESGDAFVKEIEFSRLVVRVRDSKEEVSQLGYWTGSVQDVIKSIMKKGEEEVYEYKLLNCNGGLIRLNFKFFPVIHFKLDPAESLENQGNLTVTAISAKELRAADKSGTSDPYVVFSVNGEKVYKTETYKKQLTPTFKNEFFTVPITNRVKTKVFIKIYDWDQFGSHELLAEGPLVIDKLKSFTAEETEVPLRGGSIKVRMKWEPQLLARKRIATSLLGSTTRILTSTPTSIAGNVVDLGVGAGGKALNIAGNMVDLGVGMGGKAINTGTKIVGGVVGGSIGVIGGGINVIGGGISAIGSGFRNISSINKKDKPPDVNYTNVASIEIPAHAHPTPPSSNDITPKSSDSQNDLSNSWDMSSSSGTQPTESIKGKKTVFDERDKNATVRVILVGGRGIKANDKIGDPYCRVRLGKITVHKTKYIRKTAEPEWNESFVSKVFESSTFDIAVKEHRTLADSDVGQVSFTASDHVDAGKPFDGWISISPSGSGEIHIKVEVIEQSV